MDSLQVKEVHRKVWQQILNKTNQSEETESRPISIQPRIYQNLTFESDIFSKLPPNLAQE